MRIALGLPCLIVLLAVAFACATTPEPDRNRQGPNDVLPVTSPVSGEPGFVPHIRTFRIVPEASEARYEVDEELIFLGISLNRAIGRTSELSGEFSFYQDSTDEQFLVVTSGHFQVDLSKLKSDDTRRDERIRDQWLESFRFPLAVFEAKEVGEFPNDVLGVTTNAVNWTFELKGDMTVREVTREETLVVQVNIIDGNMDGTVTTHLKMKDYGFSPPNISGLMKVEEGVDVVVEFRAEELLASR
ncbi:MAG: YceI family protein [Chloroflexi bacterium]|nr:YceI family protein [Chloroflexota bacterium]MDA1227055.1 YceI family protein [Chloroflexota bacterium]